MYIRDIEKRRFILKNHLLLQGWKFKPKKKSTIFFMHIFATLLIEHDKLQDKDEDDDVPADFRNTAWIKAK